MYYMQHPDAQKTKKDAKLKHNTVVRIDLKCDSAINNNIMETPGLEH